MAQRLGHFCNLDIEMETSQSNFLDTVQLSDGRTVNVRKFQACEAVAASLEIAALGITDSPTEVLMYLVSKFAEVIQPEGPATPLSFSDIKRMRSREAARLTKCLTVDLDIKETTADGIRGLLPSGRSFTALDPTVQDKIDSERESNREMRIYALIAKCVTIDGQPIPILDVQIMDGMDFMPLWAWFNQAPQ